MIATGIATIYVNDLEQSVAFYTDVLGMTIQMHVEGKWAQVDAGRGFAIGLHPRSEKAPPPGTSGSISLGLYLDEPIEAVVQRLTDHGVALRGPIVDDGPTRLAFFGDPDGNDLYLCESEY